MIKNYVTKIEAYDDMDESTTVFTLETFEGDCVTLKINHVVTEDSLDELFSAIRQGVEMMSSEKEKIK